MNENNALCFQCYLAFDSTGSSKARVECPHCGSSNSKSQAEARFKTSASAGRAAGTPDPKPDAPSERGAGLKFDGGKPRWSLLMQGCAKALAGVAEVLTFGAKKYSAHSWKQVENNTERYRDALYRHLNAIERGELVDPESGLPHWDHIACNALFLSELNHERT